MIPSLIILAALVVVGGILYLLYRRDMAREGADMSGVEQPGRPVECCGQHEVCEKTTLLVTPGEEVEYFDDEELDRFAGRDADGYSDEEIDEIRDVLLTLRPDEVAPWARSMQLRGVTLPTPVREELLMMVAEERQTPDTI